MVARTALKEFTMTAGTVEWFSATKGFGVIQPDNGGPDASAHNSAVERFVRAKSARVVPTLHASFSYQALGSGVRRPSFQHMKWFK